MGTLDPNDLPALQFAHRVGEELRPILERSTVPIIGVRKDALDESRPVTVVSGDRLMTQRGTGTVFRIADHSLLVTAYHVFKALERQNERPHTHYDDPDAVLPLFGPVHVVDQPFDIAAMDLDRSVVDGLLPQRFLGLESIDFRPNLHAGWYFLHGFPTASTRTSLDFLSMHQMDFTYRTGLYAGSTSGFRDYDSTQHVLLAMDGESRYSDDGSPAELPPKSDAELGPKLGGISGSSIWMGFADEHYMDDWTPDMAKVVGVQTKLYIRRRVVQGTRWRVVAAALWQGCPDLRDELSDHIPEDLVDSFRSL
ncbi:MAG TPA: hypothetical protein VMY37_27920 [Thermoguttaceae bacterium]|nr:hypothetical protein [Thermoguttaceae bacterium]